MRSAHMLCKVTAFCANAAPRTSCFLEFSSPIPAVFALSTVLWLQLDSYPTLGFTLRFDFVFFLPDFVFLLDFVFLPDFVFLLDF